MKPRLGDAEAASKAALLGREIHRFEEVGSTNEIARGLASQGKEEGCVVVAERQRLGRGRSGRSWYSPAGGLWFSVILRPEMEAREAPRLTLTAAVAIADAIRDVVGLTVEVKWPNDLLIRGRKVCGILTEAVTEGGGLDFVVVGVGINANIDRGALPREVGEAAISLREASGGEVDREELLRRSLRHLETYYGMLREGRFDLILEEWRRLARFMGEEVEIRGPDATTRGRAVDVDEDGALIIELTDGTRRRVTSGDVSLRVGHR